jgi:predicted CoA-binding protein
MIDQPIWPVGVASHYRIFIGEDGTIFGQNEPYLDIIGKTSIDALEGLLSQEGISILKRLLPYHDDSLRQIFLTARKLVVIGEESEATDSIYNSTTVARFFRDAGYNVFSALQKIKEIPDFEYYPTILELPAPVDIIYISDPEASTSEIVKQAKAVGTRLIWADFADIPPEHRVSGIDYVLDSPGIIPEFRRIAARP